MDVNKKKEIVDKVMKLYKRGVNLHTINGLVTDLMGYIGSVKGLSGLDKKKEVIDLTIFVIKNTDSGPLEDYESYIIDILPVLIDILIQVQDGKLRFNPVVFKLFSCFR